MTINFKVKQEEDFKHLTGISITPIKDELIQLLINRNFNFNDIEKIKI